MPDEFAPLPGDTIGLPGGERGRVETVYLCSEPSGPPGDTAGELTRWSWIVLSDGRLLETAPRGCALYGPPQILARGSGPFLELVAQDGALIRFEERVRAGTWQARPVRLTLDRRRWRVTSTGTVSARRLEAVPESAWAQLGGSPTPSRCAARISAAPTSSPVRGGGEPKIACSPSPTHEGRGWGSGASSVSEPDVYFTLVGLTDPAALGLGLWAQDITLAFGRRLGDTPAAAGLLVLSDEDGG